MSTTESLNDVQIDAVAGLATKIGESPEVADTVWRARVDWTGGFRSQATVREFSPVPSDEPEALGGTDTAANPVEQLLGALGNCLAVGYAANATTAGVQIDGLTIDVEGDLNLKTFLGLDPDGHAGFRGITVSVHLDTDADQSQHRGAPSVGGRHLAGRPHAAASRAGRHLAGLSGPAAPRARPLAAGLAGFVR